MILLALACVVVLLLSGAFSGMETGLYSAERVRLQLRAAGGDRRAASLLAMVQAPTTTVVALLLLNNMTHLGLSELTGDLLSMLTGAKKGTIELELLSTVWVVPVLFVFGELVPKTLFMRHPGTLVPWVQPLFSACSFLLTPIVKPFAWFVRLISGGDQDEGDSLLRRRALMGVLTVEDESEGLTAAQRAIAARVTTLQDLPVRARMVPSSRVVSVAADATASDVLTVAGETLRSRILVRTQDGRDFLGYVRALDAAFPSEPFDLQAILHRLPEVDAEVSLARALASLQRVRRSLALVRDRGRAVGILAVADIIRPLLGTQKTPPARERPSRSKPTTP